ncbi:hypothetical protein QWZ16_18965 [Vibrio ostreicida]|uniref:Uncharacterized protein n=1 Tax=Vibrio ostreicida TaxID=526588 RepID=A0ABT8BZ44_9VIBR|nr:hypothetical protein [Vibrio ostreicida]MDN3611684.1 hypothetical protein [Vibrio ostreicida]
MPDIGALLLISATCPEQFSAFIDLRQVKSACAPLAQNLYYSC